MQYPEGLLFPEQLRNSIKAAFCHTDLDPTYGERLFFDNSGGSLRLKKSVEAKAALECIPDCPERTHERARALRGLVDRATKEILEVVFGASKGALITELTASQTMFHMVGIIMENVAGTNAVVSSIEHPSAFDAVAYHCKRTGKELRVIPANRATGEIDPTEVARLVDKDTCLLSVMSASNATGSIMDIEGIVKCARQIKPALYIISDAVQHAPHALLEVERIGLDGVNIAPYKFFGVRGCGFAYVSERVARLPHRKLLAKPAEVFELGTCAPGNFAAMLEVIEYVCGIGDRFVKSTDRRTRFAVGMEHIHLQERALLHRLLEGTERVAGLRHIKGVRVHVDTRDLTRRDLIAAIEIDGMSYEACVEEYEKRGVIVCDRVPTSMYAKRILDALGLDGAIRVSPLHCHTPEDIDKFLSVTAKIAATH